MSDQRLPTIEPTQAEREDAERAERKRTLDDTLEGVNRVMDNSDGIARILAITPEEWDEAQALDDAEEAGDASS